MFRNLWKSLIVALTLALSWSGDTFAQTSLYISGVMHIESNPLTWPADPVAFVEFFDRATLAGYTADRGTGMRWSIGADIDWFLMEDPAVVTFIVTETTALGVQWDIHAHDAADRGDCAQYTAAAGATPTTVCSGLNVSEIDALRSSVTSSDGSTTWQATTLWGLTTRSGHGASADDRAYGCWRPVSSARWTSHNRRGSLIAVGGGARNLTAVGTFAVNLELRGAAYPVTSASINVRPETLLVVDTADGIAQIEAWATTMSALNCVEWATISETATAWAHAGGINSRVP